MCVCSTSANGEVVAAVAAVVVPADAVTYFLDGGELAQMAKQQKQETLSVVEAAKRLDVEVNYAYALVRSGRLEARKADRQWLVSADAVRERQLRLEK